MGLGKREKGIYFEGNRGTNTIFGNTENMKTILDFWRSGEHANLFQGNTETGTPSPLGSASIITNINFRTMRMIQKAITLARWKKQIIK